MKIICIYILTTVLSTLSFFAQSISITAHNGSSPHWAQPSYTGNAVVRWSSAESLFIQYITADVDAAVIADPSITDSFNGTYLTTSGESDEKWISIWTSTPMCVEYAGILDAFNITYGYFGVPIVSRVVTVDMFRTSVCTLY